MVEHEIIKINDFQIVLNKNKELCLSKFKSIFLQTLMETLFNEAVKKMVKAFESRANDLYN